MRQDFPPRLRVRDRRSDGAVDYPEKASRLPGRAPRNSVPSGTERTLRCYPQNHAGGAANSGKRAPRGQESTDGHHPPDRADRRPGAAARAGPADQPVLHQSGGPSVRRGRVGDARRAHRPRRQRRLRAEGRRVPQDVVAERDQHRRPEVLPRPAGLARPRALGQADDRPRRRHDRRLGPRPRLLRHGRGRRHLRGRAHLHPAAPDRGLQQPGLVQRRLRGEPAVLRLLHPLRRGHDGVDPRLEHQGGQDLPRRLGRRASTSRTSAARWSR